MVLLTAELVAKHNKEDDCWVIVHGKVYDVTKYLEDHPGGPEIITDLAGQDCSEEFDDVGHSTEASEILEGLYIGDLNGDSEDPNKSPKNKELSEHTTQLQATTLPPEEDKFGTYMMYAGAAAAVASIGFFILRRSA